MPLVETIFLKRLKSERWNANPFVFPGRSLVKWTFFGTSNEKSYIFVVFAFWQMHEAKPNQVRFDTVFENYYVSISCCGFYVKLKPKIRSALLEKFRDKTLTSF